MHVALIVGSMLAPVGAMAKGADGPTGLSAPWSIATPTRAGSREPNLAALPDGGLVMCWLEPVDGTAMALRCATYHGKKWSRPATIASGDSFFVNWADFPSIRSLGGNRLAAHWLWRSGAGTYAYDVRVSQSEDGGRSWSRPITPHRDGTASEHGFASLLANGDGAWAVWLDGRKMAGHEEGSPEPMPDMALRATTITKDGRLLDEVELDNRTCDCCQTAAVTTDRGVLVAYRDRSPDEVRDIYVTRSEGGRWTPPRPVHADNWHIAGCPVNGPALAAERSHVAIAWYTAAGDTPRVHVAFSEDAGASFGPAIRIDDGSPLGRVHIALLEDGSALATWLESSGRDALFQARRIPAHGPLPAAITVARTSAARASGCPRVVRSGRAIVFAWTEAGTTPQVHLAGIAGK
ncbi:MAG: sialidase family protein [Candidatus Eisenbacteria bacterium]